MEKGRGLMRKEADVGIFTPIFLLELQNSAEFLFRFVRTQTVWKLAQKCKAESKIGARKGATSASFLMNPLTC